MGGKSKASFFGSGHRCGALGTVIATSLVRTGVGRVRIVDRDYIVPDVPKTRSGKIMRRVLAAISNGRDIGDVTTLANPGIVEEIRRMVQG